MPTLDWIGKKAVLNHHNEVPFRLLKCRPELSVGDPGSGNLLIQGDNLEALKALLPYYAGKVKCIYIDPPYNTGNENWIYNDAVNSPEMKAWLGKVVGKEAEDLSRHDKWLCMMWPRLSLSRDFLSKDGIILISINDIELANLRTILDDIFGRKNLVATFVWKTEGNFDNQAKVKICHEYVLVYAKYIQDFEHPPLVDPSLPANSKIFNSEIRNTIVKNGPKNPVSKVTLPSGFPAGFEEGIIKARTNKWPHYDKDLAISNSKLQETSSASSGWSSKKILLEFIKNGFQPVPDSKGQSTSFELTREGAIEAVKPRSVSQSHVLSFLVDMGSTQQSSAELQKIGIEFSYPKPIKLMKYLLSLLPPGDHIVLDFFAGSGTTAQAVIELNKLDGSSRRFILTELDPLICTDIAARRLSILFSPDEPNSQSASTFGYRYCELGHNLLCESGEIREAVSFADLAHHVFFTETGEPLPKPNHKKSPLLGVANGVAVFLLYNGILDDKSPNGGNALTTHTLELLPKHDGPKVIYGTSCRLSVGRLRRESITFRQIPYHVKVK